MDQIISVLRADVRQDLVILIIPSHDKKDLELNNQEMWAHAAMELFADLYGGATAFRTFAGIYKAADGKILHDNPILVESYTSRDALEDRDNLTELLRFAKRMGRETNQAAVGLVINSVFHEITSFE
jgi:hypothetical protein